MSTILRIFDFDKTISIEHTSHNPALYPPESNTKSGLQKAIVHNDQEICAIATFHKDPGYVLSYLLPVLGLTKNDITRCELQSFTDHQLTKVYLKNCKYSEDCLEYGRSLPINKSSYRVCPILVRDVMFVHPILVEGVNC